MLTFQNVIKYYRNGNQALHGISFSLAKGELAFLVGASGAGKSTIMKLILGIERPTQGQILMWGKDIAKFSKSKIAKLRKSIGVIFQEPVLHDDQKVFDNVALPLVLSGYTRITIAKKVHSALDMVGLLDREKEYPLAMSFSERQRICIARAIVDLPELVLADEPTHGMDYNLSKEIMHLLMQLNQVGTAVLIATNDATKITSNHCQILNLQNGSLVDGR